MEANEKKPNETSDFDWVKARYEASPDGLFETLKAQAARSVETRNAQLGPDPRFRFKQDGDNQFSVWNTNVNGVRFYRDLKEIEISHVALGDRVKDAVSVQGTVGEDGLVRVEYEGKKLLAWQLLEAVLGKVLFPT